MSVSIIVERRGTEVSLSEWMRLIDDEGDLPLRVEPYVAVNPKIERISIKTGEADTEIQVNGQWLPFLRFGKGGVLSTKYVKEFDDPQNATRIKIAVVAKRLGASIRTDASDEFLSW